MNRRRFLALFASVPLLGWLKPASPPLPPSRPPPKPTDPPVDFVAVSGIREVVGAEWAGPLDGDDCRVNESRYVWRDGAWRHDSGPDRYEITMDGTTLRWAEKRGEYRNGYRLTPEFHDALRKAWRRESSLLGGPMTRGGEFRL